MAESEERLKETEVKEQGDTQVVRERTSTSSTEERQVAAGNFIWFIIGILEALLIFRFVLKLLGANPSSGFVDIIYTISGIFAAPFNGIFSTPTTEGDVVGSIFETGTLVAIVVYALVGWGLVSLVNINKRKV